MLPAGLRMRRSGDFVRTIRTGSRAGRPTLVVHCRTGAGQDRARVGFVVSRTVGGAVVRNVVRRRLRGLVLEHVDELPLGADVVVRALAPAAEADYARLGEDYRSALGAAVRRDTRRTDRP